MLVQFTNMVDTAYRHPYRGNENLSWQDLNIIHKGIAEGKTMETLELQPFPYRRFIYAFETAAAYESDKGKKIDLIPFKDPQQGLASWLELPPEWQDPSLLAMSDTKPSKREGILVGKPLPLSFFYNGIFRGEINNWGYLWKFDNQGNVTQESWRFGLMRTWTSIGRLEKSGGQICIIFSSMNDHSCREDPAQNFISLK